MGRREDTNGHLRHARSVLQARFVPPVEANTFNEAQVVRDRGAACSHLSFFFVFVLLRHNQRGEDEGVAWGAA